MMVVVVVLDNSQGKAGNVCVQEGGGPGGHMVGRVIGPGQ